MLVLLKHLPARGTPTIIPCSDYLSITPLVAPIRKQSTIALDRATRSCNSCKGYTLSCVIGHSHTKSLVAEYGTFVPRCVASESGQHNTPRQVWTMEDLRYLGRQTAAE